MPNNSNARREIALGVASLIVNEQMPWSLARDRVKEDYEVASNAMPSSEEIESAVRENWALFDPETHRKVLLAKRRLALDILGKLENFQAYLCGAVLNGCAGETSNIQIEIFEDDIKAVEIALMEAGYDFEAIEDDENAMPTPLETLGFLIKNPYSGTIDGVQVAIYSTKHQGLNPYKRKNPDPWQEAWETSGRITKSNLFLVICD